MKSMFLAAAASGLVMLVLVGSTDAGEKKKKMMPIPKLKTGKMGQVPNPDKATILAMHKGQYILHARGAR